MDIQKVLLLGGAGAAAWYLFLRPGAAMFPAAPAKPTTVVKPPSTSDQVKAAAIAAAPSLITEIAKLISPSPAPTPTAEQQVSSGNVSFDWSTL